MQNPYDFKKYAVLYVDDELMALKYFEKTFGGEFRIITAENAAEGMRIIEERGDEIGILLTDQRMPGEKGVQLLERARQLRPRIVRMIITAYADLGVTVDAVNLGNIFRYVSKPLQVADMRNTLRRAMEFFLVQHERDDLLQEKLSVLQNVLVTDRVISMGVLAAGLRNRFRRPLAAIEAFLQTTANVSMAESVLHREALNPGFWKEFHQAVVGQAKRVVAMLDEVEGSLKKVADGTTSSVGAGISEGCAAAAPVLEERGLHVQVAEGAAMSSAVAPPGVSQVVAMLLRVESALLEVGNSIQLSATVDEGSVTITASHEGVGIPASDLRAVFDPRFESEGKGLDWGLSLLGLFIAVFHLGGSLRLSSPRGDRGATMKVQLPAQGAPGSQSDIEDGEFVSRVLVNDALWARVLSVLG